MKSMMVYGFSATLVGVGLTFFFQPTLIIWIGIIVGSALATIIQHYFIIKKIPVFTFPFILVTWLLLSITYYFPVLVQPITPLGVVLQETYFSLFPLGFGQVIFQGNILSGLFFFIGVLINRPIAAVYAVFGIALSSIIAFGLHEPLSNIYMGLLSYNAVLCAIVFAGRRLEDFVLGILSVSFSVLVMSFMSSFSLPALTFPFVLATWLALFVKIAWQKTGLNAKPH